ncbi:DUF58 domain-containing protein [Humidisolicoccus flavus]|uniref:DUF58 domain-containing protein n=1 Tax=Humidisolicoccus flavus TaxID=3111414 RepID=UPI0032537551
MSTPGGFEGANGEQSPGAPLLRPRPNRSRANERGSAPSSENISDTTSGGTTRFKDRAPNDATSNTVLAALSSALDEDSRATFVERVKELWARVVELATPFLGPITAFGWSVVVFTGLALVFGIILDWKEAIVGGLLGLFLLAGAVLFVLGRARYRIELDLAYTRVVVGERALGRIEIHSTSPRPLLPALIEVPVGQAVASFNLPRMNPRDIHEDVFAIPTSKRTVLQVGPVRSVRGDALGLLRRQVKWTDPVELFVHPRTTLLQETVPGLIRDLEGITTNDITNSDISFHALRDYVPGDDRRYIHWKSSARTGKLMIRQFEETRRSILALGLSTMVEDYADPEEFETAISVLGSVGVQAIRDEMDIVVETSKETLAASTSRRLLDSLSAVGWHPRHDSVVGLAGSIGRKHPSASVIFIHAGATVEMVELRRARQLLPSNARVFFVMAGMDAEPRVRSLGDSTLITLKEIGELPRIVRQVVES